MGISYKFETCGHFLSLQIQVNNFVEHVIRYPQNVISFSIRLTVKPQTGFKKKANAERKGPTAVLLFNAFKWKIEKPVYIEK